MSLERVQKIKKKGNWAFSGGPLDPPLCKIKVECLFLMVFVAVVAQHGIFLMKDVTTAP